MKKQENTISFDVARRHAADALSAIEKTAGTPLAIIDEYTERVERGFVFFYNSQAFVASRDFRDALAGNGPIFVRHNGKVDVLSTSRDWRQQLGDGLEDGCQ